MRRCLVCLLAVLALLTGCSSGPPKNITNSCDIFVDRGGWYRDASRAFEKWGVPIHVQLAIIYQESRFVDDAKPPRDHILWIIPWGRISSAYGYAQAQDSTWDWYIEKTGNRGADRDDFDDAVDFIALGATTVQVCRGADGWVSTVTSYSSPSRTVAAKVALPSASMFRSSPPWFCSTTPPMSRPSTLTLRS